MCLAFLTGKFDFEGIIFTVFKITKQCISLTKSRAFANQSWENSSVFGVILIRIFPHSDWIRRDTEYLRIQSECGKMQTRIIPIWTLFTQWKLSTLFCQFKNLKSLMDSEGSNKCAKEVLIPFLFLKNI